METPNFEKPNKKEQKDNYQEMKEFFKREEILKDVDSILTNLSDRSEVRKIIADRYSGEFEGRSPEDIFNAWFDAFKETIGSQPEDSSEKEE